MKKIFIALGMGISVLSMGSLQASAASLNDVISAARAIGLPETYIQEGINHCQQNDYTPEQYDAIVEGIYANKDAIWQKIDQEMGVSTTVTATPTETVPTTTVTEVTTTGQGNGQGNTITGEKTTTITTAKTTAGGNTQTTAKGETGTTVSDPKAEFGVSVSEFLKMTMEQKKAFIAGLTAEQQSAFLNTLTPEERLSIAKQLSVDGKTDIISSLISVSESLGLNMTVDEISDNSVSISVRDEEGTLVDQSSLGVIVEDTGISHTGLILLAVSMILCSAVAMGFLLKRKEITYEEG